MDVFWALVIGLPIVIGGAAELYVVSRHEWPSTLSVWLRRVFNVHTPDGKRLWYGTVGSLIVVLVWLAGHVTNVWP